MIFTVEELSALMGRTFDEQEEAQAVMMIKGAESFLESYLDTNFSIKLLAEKYVADYRGEIRLNRGPVLTITSVKDVILNEEDTDWEWDGFDVIYNLNPSQVVLVSYSSGWEEVPSDIIQIAMFMVQRLMQNPQGIRQSTTGAMSDTYVGEVGVFSLSNLEKKILEKYSPGAETWHIGSSTGYTDTLPTL